MNFELQPDLQNELVKITPLLQSDFEKLYSVASDPLIWEQHPNKERYQKDVFKKFFEGAIQSRSAFLIIDSVTGDPIGSSRYYGFDKGKSEVSVGYTFLDRDHWGTIYNRALKNLMLDHAFKFVDTVLFHIGAVNVRSQKAIEKLGAVKVAETEMEYYGGKKSLNYIYSITKIKWQLLKGF